MSKKRTPAKKNGAKVVSEKKATKVAPRKKKPEPGTWEAIQRALAFAEKKNLSWP